MSNADACIELTTPRGSYSGTSKDQDVGHTFAEHPRDKEHITCPPWKGTLKYTRDLAASSHHSAGFGTGLFVVKWCLPAFCFCVASFTCMWFLHIGTFYYVHEMEFKEAVYTANITAMDEFPEHAKYLSAGKIPTATSYGSLHDPLEAELGWQAVNMKSLDMISAVLPVTWFFATILTDDLQHWTKMLICNVFLAVGKGLFGFLTVVPDSIGWNDCKARLTPEGIVRLKEGVGKPERGFTSVFWSTFSFEVSLRWGEIFGGKGLRFCADMLYSGHTFFTTLYALGLVELTKTHLSRRVHQQTMTALTRNIIVGCVYTLAITEQAVEIYLVLLNRFHYTMDVVMAVLLVFLFFTNGSITIAAKIWYHWHGDFADGPHRVEAAKRRPGQGSANEVPTVVHDWLEQHSDQYALVPKGMVHSSGDTWTPVCCVPFCCLSGRYHIVDDHTFNCINGGVNDPDADVMESGSDSGSM